VRHRRLSAHRCQRREEAGEFVRVMRSAGLETVFLPHRPAHRDGRNCGGIFERLRLPGFREPGVTGERDSLSEPSSRWSVRCAPSRNCRWRGFGISRPEHVAELGRLVEAVVVGSAIVHLIERNLDNPSLEVQLESFRRELKHGFDKAQAGARER